MKARLGNLFSPATFIASIALFVALGGSAVAVSNTINGKLIKPGTIASKQIKDGSIAASDLRTEGNLRTEDIPKLTTKTYSAEVYVPYTGSTTTITKVVECGSGETLLSGGFQTTDDQPDSDSTGNDLGDWVDSYPTPDKQSWTVSVSSSSGHLGIAYARCAKIG